MLGLEVSLDEISLDIVLDSSLDVETVADVGEVTDTLLDKERDKDRLDDTTALDELLTDMLKSEVTVLDINGVALDDRLRLTASVHDSVYDGVSQRIRRRSNPYRGLHRPLCSRHQWHDSDTLLSHRLPFSARQSVTHPGGPWLSPRGAQYCSPSHHPHCPATRQISGSSIGTVAHVAWHGAVCGRQYSIDGHHPQIWLALQLGCSTEAA